MLMLLLAAATASGLATIASDWHGKRRPLFYLAKPLTTLLIAGIAWLALAAAPGYRSWVMAALAFCWVGDVALMSPSRRAFLLGLSAFVLGHVLFIVAFATDLPLTPLFVPYKALLGGLLFMTVVISYARWLLPRTGRLKGAVLLYLCVLSAMVLVALARAGLSESHAASAAVAGALLFALSDGVLAWRKFVAQPWWGQPLTLLSYYLAIGPIAWAH